MSPQAPADQRVERSKAAILTAAAELLVEGGASKVTIERISERSGVAKTTIYRHWNSRSHVVFDAFASLLQGSLPLATPGSLRDQLVVVLDGLIRGLTASRWAPVVASMVEAGERDEELRGLIHDFLIDRLAPCRALLAQACAAGELRDDLDVDVALSMLAGAVFYRRLVSREEMPAGFTDTVVDQFLRGANGEPRAAASQTAARIPGG